MFGDINVISKYFKIRFAIAAFLVFALENVNPMAEWLAADQKRKNQASGTDNTGIVVVVAVTSIIIQIVFYELATKCAQFDNPKCCDGWERVAECYKLAAEQVSKESPEYL